MNTTALQVRQDDLATTRLDASADCPLAPGAIRTRVESFALTANNITYAAFGDSMSYWKFFPTGEPGWGIVPVWGFATVVQSLHPGVAVGERLWGYWPMASGAVLQPERLSAAGFRDATAHRGELHAVYNQYLRCSADPFYTPDSEEVQALLRPLFLTSWLIDDLLADNGFFGADTVLMSSASSKTAYGTAWQLRQRGGVRTLGLTSERNRAFCEGLGCYDQVLAYEELDRLPAALACVYVDFAGDAPLRRRIHERFGELRYSCSVGGTHVESLGSARDLPGPRATLFFAPAQVKKRQADWGGAELGRRMAASWHAFRRHVTGGPQPWLQVRRQQGAAAVQAAYGELLAGRADPRAGHILSFH